MVVEPVAAELQEKIKGLEENLNRQTAQNLELRKTLAEKVFW